MHNGTPRPNRLLLKIFNIKDIRSFALGRCTSCAGRQCLLHTEHALDTLLLKPIIHPSHRRLQPIRMGHTRYRVGTHLQRGRNSNNLAYGIIESFNVIIPIQHITDVEIITLHLGSFEPPTHVVLHHRRFRLPNGRGHGAIRHWRAVRQLRDDELAIQSLILNDFRSKEFPETSRGSLRCAWPIAVIIELAAHVAIFANEINELVSLETFPTCVQYVNPVVGNVGNAGVALHQRLPVQKVLKHLGLKLLDQFQLAATFQLESLELGERSVKVEDGVPFLEKLAFLGTRGQYHGTIRAV
mmetsp:Transcript_19228/g.41669  ORF Transcript_19228/g.41669 Transcript_19228/m.41669 type:complete len:298 (+) Transcript_19228:3596-4489(+)